MRRIYHKDEPIDQIYADLRSELTTVSDLKVKVSIWQSISDPRYRYATWFCQFLFISRMLNGFSGILVYSTVIFKQMEERGELFITPI